MTQNQNLNSVIAIAPSNIALVKYWGKKNIQEPVNSSISFTLSKCVTKTKIEFTESKTKNNIPNFQFSFEGQSKPNFIPKLTQFFKHIDKEVPFLKNYHLKIDSSNTFPHSSGIASSASAFAALAIAIIKIEAIINNKPTNEFTQEQWYKASKIARLGSGSACRSLQGKVTLWGEHSDIAKSSDQYAIRQEDIHNVFNDYQDTVLLVEKGQKAVSSTIGHQLMENHPYKENRITQAQENIISIKQALKTGNLEQFIKIVEQEALSLHGLMMSSNPYFILMKPQTLAIIHKIWEYRKKSNSKLCFTLDAGANVHLLYPSKEKENIIEFIDSQLIEYCQEKQYLCDEVGLGATCIAYTN